MEKSKQEVATGELADKFFRLMGKSNVNLSLWKAAATGNDTLVEEYCARGATVNWKNPKYFNYSALHVASQRGHYKVACMLIQRGANVNARAAANETPLHEASHEGHQLVVLLLVMQGADLSSETNFRKTPLDFAKQNGFMEGVLVIAQDFQAQKVHIEQLRETLAKQVLQSCCLAVQARRYKESRTSRLPSLDITATSSGEAFQVKKFDPMKSIQELQLELKDVLRLTDTKKRMYAKNIAELQKQIVHLEEELTFVKQQLEKSYTENTRIEAFIDNSVRFVARKNDLVWTQNRLSKESAQNLKWRTLKSRLKDAEERAYRASVQNERLENMLRKKDGYVQVLQKRLADVGIESTSQEPGRPMHSHVTPKLSKLSYGKGG